MICPHCLRTIEDGSSFCPHCHGYVGAAASGVAEFVYCEGCGARLSSHDRTCPKCGRPAPGILSTDSASPDLAAGKTASFPRLTKRMIETEAPELRSEAPTASQVAVDSVDPFATGVLPAAAVNRAMPAAEAGEDPYHGPVRRRKWPIALAVAAAALIGGGAYFVAADPLGVMPGLTAELEAAARQMFPSRMTPESAVDAGSASTEATDETADQEDDGSLTDAQALTRLTAAYESIVTQHDALAQIIDDYNTAAFANDLDMRTEASASAYGARKVIDQVLEDLNGMTFADTAWDAQRANLVQLAGWVRIRIDMYCASWDISLSYTGSDLPYKHEVEILAPLRERASADTEARDNYFAHVASYKPRTLS